MKKKTVLLFDFDGTLADSLPLGMELANELASSFSYAPISNIDIIREQSAVQYILQQVRWYELPFWAYLMKRNAQKRIDEIQLFEHIPELLHALNQNFILGLIGGGRPSYHRYILERFNCDIFDFKYGNNGTKKHRVIASLRKKFKAENFILIGDDNHDIKAAKKTGIQSVAVTWGSSSRRRLEQENPDYIVSSIVELEALLNRFLS